MPLNAQRSPYDALAIITPSLVLIGIARFLRDRIGEDGLFILNGIRRRLNPQEATFLTRSHLERPHFPDLINQLTAGPVILLHVHGHEAVLRLHHIANAYRHAVGEDSPLINRPSPPIALQALYCSDSSDAAIRDFAYVGFTPTARLPLSNPHPFQSPLLGPPHKDQQQSA